MQDGTVKAIETIQRGEVVAPNYQVARVCQEPIIGSVDMMMFEPHCLGQHPDQRLMITPNHPIITMPDVPPNVSPNAHGVSMGGGLRVPP